MVITVLGSLNSFLAQCMEIYFLIHFYIFNNVSIISIGFKSIFIDKKHGKNLCNISFLN